MTGKRWPAARIAKVWIDIGVALLMVGGTVLVGAVAIAPLVWDEGQGGDLNVVVAVGERPLFPVVRLVARSATEGSSPIRDAHLVKATGELRAVTSNLGLHMASMGAFAGAVFLVAWVFWSIRQVIRSALDGHPFDRRNVSRLRRAGVILVAGSLAWPLSQYALATAVLNRVTIEGVPLSASISSPSDGILSGLLLLVLAAVFAHGADLEDERSLTV
jgi:hypothetical protein